MFKNTLHWLNENATLPFCFVLLLGLCAFWHRFAVGEIATGEIPTAPLLVFMDNRPWLVTAYLAIVLAILFFSAWRRHPRWSRWLTFSFLAAPCIVYLHVCGTVFVGPVLQ